MASSIEVSGAGSDPILPCTRPPAASSSSGSASSIITLASSSARWSSGSVTRCSPCAAGGTSRVNAAAPRDARSRTASIRDGVAAVLWATTRTRAGSATKRLPRVAQPLRLGQRLQLLQGVVLDLADPLARDVERAADLLQRPRPLAGQPEAHLDDLALALRQSSKSAAHVVAPQVLGGQLERRLGRMVLDEVAQLGLHLVADR